MSSQLPASFTVAPVQRQMRHCRRGGGARTRRFSFLWATLLICGSYIFEGPVRYVLLMAHAPTLIYLRDLAALGFVAFAVSLWMGGERRLFPLVVAVYALFLHLLCGVLLLPSVAQPLLGLKVFFTFLFGMAASMAIAERSGRCCVSLFWRFSRRWAACCSMRSSTSPGRGRPMSRRSRRFRFRASGARAESRGCRVSRVRPSTLQPFSCADRAHSGKPLARRVESSAVVDGLRHHLAHDDEGRLARVVALAVWGFLESLRGARRLVIAWIASFAGLEPGAADRRISVRLRRSPRRSGALAQLFRRAHRLHVARCHRHVARARQLVTGRGLGGIGFAQLGLEWWRYNAADNLMIYLLVSFGLFALLYVGAFLRNLPRTFGADESQALLAQCVRGWAVVALQLRMHEQHGGAAAHESRARRLLWHA